VALVLDVYDEVTARCAVDVDRVFLAGHGVGADAVWTIGVERPHLFAGLAATSGTKSPGAKAAAASGFTTFLYHSTSDPSAPVAVTRAAADALLAASGDVVYLELPDQGHAFPSEAMREMFDAFRGKRRNDARRPSAWPTSSFARKPTPEEVRVLGDPAAAWAAPK
jgi:predicted esterase